MGQCEQCHASAGISRAARLRRAASLLLCKPSLANNSGNPRQIIIFFFLSFVVFVVFFVVIRAQPLRARGLVRSEQSSTLTNSAESNKRRCLPCPKGWELPYMLQGRLATGVASPLNKCPVASPPKQQCSIIHAA